MSASADTFDVLCYGTISVDEITHLPYLPNARRDAAATHEYVEVGGEAARVAIPLAAWGLSVLVVGNVIGTDWKGEFILQQLARYPNINTRHIRQQPNIVTPFSRLLVTPDGERSRIAYWYDATPKTELTKAIMAQANLLSVDAYGRGERDRAAATARSLGRPVIAADAIWLKYPLAGLCDAVIISNVWLKTNFPGVYEYDHALQLQEQGAGVVIVTDGGLPVLVVRADSSTFGIAPYELPRVVDTSGAGDLFKAGIIYGWLKPDWPLEQKVKFACGAAGIKCARSPGDDAPPTLDEIARLMDAQPR